MDGYFQRYEDEDVTWAVWQSHWWPRRETWGRGRLGRAPADDDDDFADDNLSDDDFNDDDEASYRNQGWRCREESMMSRAGGRSHLTIMMMMILMMMMMMRLTRMVEGKGGAEPACSGER